MPKYEVRDVVCDYGVFEDGKLILILNSRSNAQLIVKILEADQAHHGLLGGITFEEVLARNIAAWETSKDKREGLLPEVYLTDRCLFRKLTGLEPTWKNLQKFAPGLGDRVII